MSQDLSTASDEKIQSFWDCYIRSLHEAGILQSFDHWYVRRAEEYIDAHKGQETGRRSGLRDWHYRQIVDAIQKLFEFIGVVGVGRLGPLAGIHTLAATLPSNRRARL